VVDVRREQTENMATGLKQNWNSEHAK